jgi:glycerol-3-phosphate dehydrogenase
MRPIHADIAILGGGIAGLWLVNLLRAEGYNALLIEKRALGTGQTLASQGMIHGGIKYTLAGALTDSSETIASMPMRWQQCLEGNGPIDLRGVEILSDSYYLFSDGRLSSRVTAFFGSKAIESRVTPVSDNDRPAAFDNPDFKGLLYRLQDMVINADSLVKHLAAMAEGAVVCGVPSLASEKGTLTGINMEAGLPITADRYIFAAGKGNGDLIHELGLPLTQQLRPLNQVVVAGPGLPQVYAHAVSLKSGDKPRMTITTHSGWAGNSVWYLGGELAESGVSRSDAEQIALARKELSQLFPWVSLEGCHFSTLRIDRAEAGQKEEKRPDTPFVKSYGNVTVCWPTKLTLAPLMGDMVLAELSSLATPAPRSQQSLPFPTGMTTVGAAPWNQPT